MESNYQMLHLHDGAIGDQPFARNRFVGQPMSFIDYEKWPVSLQNELGPNGTHAIYRAAGNGWQNSRFLLDGFECNTDAWPSVVIPSQSCPGDGSEWFYTDESFGDVDECGNDVLCPGSIGENGLEMIEQGEMKSKNTIDKGLTNINEFSIAPNPVSERLTLNYNSPSSPMKVRVDLIGVNGQIVFSRSFPNGLVRETIDVSSLPPGFYLIRLTDGDKTLQRGKVIIR